MARVNIHAHGQTYAIGGRLSLYFRMAQGVGKNRG